MMSWWSARAGVNPARAGMIPTGALEGLEDTGKPRASGDDPRGRVKVLDLHA